MEKICPKCGASSKVKKFFGDFCEDCFIGMIGISFPASVELQLCRICGRVKSLKWEELGKNVLENIVRRNATGSYDHFHVIPLGRDQYEVVFLASSGSNYFEVKRKFSLKMRKCICDDCSKETSGYYEAILQVRGSRAGKVSAKILKQLKRKTFVSRYQETKEGIDMYVGSKKELAGVLGEMNLKPKISDKLYGVKDGRRVYRRTYCVRV